MLFKILKGDSSRISTDITPFHDGYAYFTPDDGGFYIDSEDNGVQRRVRVEGSNSGGGGSAGGGGMGGTTISAVLYADEWVNDEQTVIVSAVAGNSNGVIGIDITATTEQYEAARNAMFEIVGQGEGTVTIRADYGIPNVDIPIIILMMDNTEVSQGILSASQWVNSKQTIPVNGLTVDSNGVVGIAANATAEQTEAANLASFKINSQGNGSMEVQVMGIQPTIDVPISVILTTTTEASE